LDWYVIMTFPRLSQDEVQHIALIYRLGLSQEEIESLRLQLSDILENFQVLDQVDTSGVPPTGHSGALKNVMREDEAASPMSKEDTLANAPLREDDYFRVKAVLD
jgi:aspartyl-tRNA(Asn)/glutamyl-tRNA(Gln) amidotransferase subunit C